MEGQKPVELAQGYAKSDEAPAFAPAWARLGRCHRVIAKFVTPANEVAASLAEAEAALTRALSLDPQLSLAHSLYAQLEVDLGRPEQRPGGKRELQAILPGAAVLEGRDGDRDIPRGGDGDLGDEPVVVAAAVEFGAVEHPERGAEVGGDGVVLEGATGDAERGQDEGPQRRADLLRGVGGGAAEVFHVEVEALVAEAAAQRQLADGNL